MAAVKPLVEKNNRIQRMENTDTLDVDFGEGQDNFILNGGFEDQSVFGWVAYDDSVSAAASTSFTASSDLVTRTAHGYSNNQAISFVSGTLGAGVVSNKTYLVSVFDADNFSLIDPITGMTVDITADEGANSVGIKQVDFVDGTGGSGGITIDPDDSAPINENWSALIAKAASNQAGHGVSYDFDIQPFARGKMLRIRIRLNLKDGDLLSEKAVKVLIRDTTNNVTLEPTPFYFSSMVEGPERQYEFNGYFQANTNSLTYRLALHWFESAASAYELLIDDILVGPDMNTVAPNSTDFESYTPEFTGLGTVTNALAKWKMVGDQMLVMGSVTTGTTAASLFSVSLPLGKSIDDGKLSLNNDTSNPGNSVGDIENADGTGRRFELVTAPDTSLGVIYAGVGGTRLTPGNGNTWPASTILSFWFMVPIKGASGQTIMSAGLLARSLRLQASGPVSTGTPYLIYPTVNESYGIGYNTSTGEIEIYEDGVYEISLMANTDFSAHLGWFVIDGVETTQLEYDNTFVQSNSQGYIQGITSVKLSAGNKVKIKMNSTCGAASVHNRLFVTRISGQTQPVPGDKILAEYHLSAHQTGVPDMTETKVNWDVPLIDTHGRLSNGRYTADRAGTLRMYVKLCIGSSPGQRSICELWKNGVYFKTIIMSFSSTEAMFMLTASISVRADKAGDYFEIYGWQSSGGTNNFNGDPVDTPGDRGHSFWIIEG